jgi:DNA-binding response OmpR family regulator
LNLPGLGGVEVIARLKIADPEARILVLNMHDDYIHVTRAQAGAAGYVSKNAPPEELLEAVRARRRRAPYVEHVAGKLVFSNLRMPMHPLDDLSSRDLEMLRLWPRAAPFRKSPTRSASPIRLQRTAQPDQNQARRVRHSRSDPHRDPLRPCRS